jgi:hypothetical protein
MTCARPADRRVINNISLPQGDGPVFKKLSLVVAALVLMVGNAMADDAISAADLNVAAISDADNTVVEANLDIDADALAAGKTSDKSEQAIEACFRRFGGYGGYGYGCGYYNYNCYSPCYYQSYCYQPCYHTYYVYRPVCYSYVSYPLYHWGCY